MNRFLFGIKNISDKCSKVIGNPALLGFYFDTYILSRLDSTEPDAYVVSYPKSGRTWLRILLQKYLDIKGCEKKTFRDKSLIQLPDNHVLKFEHDKANWVPAPHSSKKISFDQAKYRGKKIVFLVRDPRDVLVSSWYHLKFRENIYAEGLSEFIRDDLVGIHKLVIFMNMWVESSHLPEDFLLMMYEDMHRDPVQSFSRLLHFLHIEADHYRMEMAIQESAFEKMKKMEQQGSLKEPWMKPGAKNSEKSMKIRKGKVGGYREDLSVGDIQYLNEYIRQNLSSKFTSYQTSP
jgi:hypothetical protein